MKGKFHILVKTCLIIIWITGCQTTKTSDDEPIINDIFLELVKELQFEIVEPYGPMPPPPASLFPETTTQFPETYMQINYTDTFININRNDIIKYIIYLRERGSKMNGYYNQKFVCGYEYIEPIIILADTIWEVNLELRPHRKSSIPEKFIDCITNKPQSNFNNKQIDFKKISNTGIFKLERASKLGFKPSNFKDFNTTIYENYISGALSFSQVVLCPEKEIGWFVCERYFFNCRKIDSDSECRNERANYLVLIEKKSNE